MKNLSDKNLNKSVSNYGNEFASMKFPYRYTHYCKAFSQKIKNGRERQKYGVGHKDVWGFDTYLITTIINGLRMLARDTNCFPGDKEFPTCESWIDKLNEIADSLEDCLEFDSYSELENECPFDFEQEKKLKDGSYETPLKKGYTKKDITKYLKKLSQAEQKNEEKLQKSLHWVMIHIRNLWW